MNSNVNGVDSSDTEYELVITKGEMQGLLNKNTIAAMITIKYPDEKLKTLYSCLILLVSFVLTTTSLALVHDKVPSRVVCGRLPDIVLDYIPTYDKALYASEVLIIVTTFFCIFVMMIHKHRYIVFRRVFLIMALLYIMRAVTMFVTVVPVPSSTYYCSPQLNETSPVVVVKRVAQLISGIGLSINGRHTFCGDYIYSGHTVIVVLSYLVITEYSPKKCMFLHWFARLIALVSVAFLMLAHGHYTIDVLIAYYVTTRLFWTYHTLANDQGWKQNGTNNLITREWWFFAFKYFECNIEGPLPRECEWPLPWPKKFLTKIN